MSTGRPRQKQGNGCLAFLLILSIIVGIPVIYFAVTQKPFNYPLLLVALVSFALVVLAATPWYRRLQQRFPSAAGFILTLVGTCTGIGAASAGIGEIHSSSTEYQSIVLARFLGLTVKYARNGRFSVLSLSDEDE